ncbi:hypothetical protein ES703_88232 [subsurface metagenome]
MKSYTLGLTIMAIITRPLIFVEQDKYTNVWEVFVCDGYYSDARLRTVSNRASMIFKLEGFTVDEAAGAGGKIAEAFKGIYSSGDPRK